MIKKIVYMKLTFLLFNTPLTANESQCTDNYTPIHDVQGTGFKSPLEGKSVTVKGVVTGVFTEKNRIGGFYLQSPPADWDDNILSSEGVFISVTHPNKTIERGDIYQVTGTVSEKYNVTTIQKIKDINRCSSDQHDLIVSKKLSFPTNQAALESLEGMSIDLSDLIITGQYYIGRYGQLSLSPKRLTTPTQIMLPSKTAHDQEQDHENWKIVLDDGSNQQNPSQLSYLPNMDADSAPKLGDKVEALTGNLHYSYDEYRVHATGELVLNKSPRMALPQKTKNQTRIVSFNVLNAFNGDGLGGGFPTSRGPKTYKEWIRQRDKLVAALIELDADLYGLSEVENDDFGSHSAIAEIVRTYNENVASDQKKLSYIKHNPMNWGRDAITCGFIYRPSSLTPIGKVETTQKQPFGKGRAPVLQTFQDNRSSTRFTAVVSHYKSKGGCPKDGSRDDNRLDGQSCWAQRRENSSKAILEWAPPVAAKYSSSNILVMGDLNSYAQEEAISIFKDAGWQNLGANYRRASDPYHSFVYIGQKGTLDYILGNDSIDKYVDQAYHWPINSDEPKILDYKLEHRTTDQARLWYKKTPYRSSDHDPVIVDFTF